MRLLLFCAFLLVSNVAGSFAETGICYDSDTQIALALMQHNSTRLEEILLALPDDTIIKHDGEEKKLPVFLTDISYELEKKLSACSESFVFRSFMGTVLALSVAIFTTGCIAENIDISWRTIAGMYTFSGAMLVVIAKQIYDFYGEEQYEERIEKFVSVLLKRYGHLFSGEDHQVIDHLESLLKINTRYKVPALFKSFISSQQQAQYQ